MLLPGLKQRLLLLSLVLILLLFLLWLFGANTLTRVPSSGIFVMAPENDAHKLLKHPYYSVVTRTVRV